MKKFSIILKNIVVIIIATFFTLLLLEIFSRNFIKKIPTKIFHFDKNALIWDQEISSHAFKNPSKSIIFRENPPTFSQLKTENKIFSMMK